MYRTIHSQIGLVRLENLIATDLESSCAHRVICLVFFSPSSVDAIFKLDASSSNEISSLALMILENVRNFKFISIGPSTSSKLNEYLECVLEMDEPSPQALEKVIRNICDDVPTE